MKLQTIPHTPYNDLTMAGRPPLKEAPHFGQQLTMFRKSKGLTQADLAQQLHTTQKMIDYYERRAINPSVNFVRRAAEVLGFSVDELLGHSPKVMRGRPGPPSKLELYLEQLRHLPRKDQKFVTQFLDTYLEKAVRL